MEQKIEILFESVDEALPADEMLPNILQSREDLRGYLISKGFHPELVTIDVPADFPKRGKKIALTILLTFALTASKEAGKKVGDAVGNEAGQQAVVVMQKAEQAVHDFLAERYPNANFDIQPQNPPPPAGPTASSK